MTEIKNTKDMYRFYCNSCGYNFYSNGTDFDNLSIYKRSSIMKSTPILDETNKTVDAKFVDLPKKFKCKKCGQLISPKKVKFIEKEEKE